MLKLSEKHKGFTIIEVLVVLAIAGLIMVVVFLAVPALQRTGRNNALNSDARSVLAAVGNYRTNNGGTLPAAQAAAPPTSGVVTVGTTGNTETARVGQGTVSVRIDDGSSPITAGSATVGTMEVITGTNAVCNGTASGLSGTGSATNYVVLYVAEGGGGNILKCIGA